MPTPLEAWRAMAAASSVFYASGPAASVGASDRWFATLSGLDNAELNICGLLPGAAPADADALLATVGPELPAIAFTSADVLPGTLARMVEAGYEIAQEIEPVMLCRAAPEARPGGYVVRPASGDEEHAVAFALMSEAHRVPADLLATAVGSALASPHVQAWLAWEGDVAVSVVWIVREGAFLVAREMMTPPRFQRRGAGRAVLGSALAASWTPDVRGAVLLSTQAGFRLYSSLGFRTVDASRTAFRGVDEDVLEAIGQQPA